MTSPKPFEHSRHVVFEHYLSRYTAGCFVHDDIVKVTDAKGFLSDQRYLDLPADTREKLKEMIEASVKGDAKLAVQDVSIAPTGQAFEPSTLTLAYSKGGGLYFGGITIPGSLGKYLSVEVEGANRVNNVPADAWHDGTIERTEVDLEAQKKEYAKGHAGQFEA